MARGRHRFRSASLTAGLVLVIIASACNGGRRAPTAPTAISPQAQAYLDELIGLMEAHSINRLKIDWGAFRTNVMAAAGAAQTVDATVPAIQTALRLLGDGHSFFRPVNRPAISAATRICGGASAGVPALPGTVGYARVGPFGGSGAEASEFANALQRAIAAADRDGLAGWIVDLRGNTGGNMWPMLAGVGPVLGEGRVGYFIDPVGTETAWEYRDGASWEGGSLSQRVDAPYRLRRELPKVAVLIDNGTASSGEAVLIAFQRRPNTRSFGTATCGLSTANEQYTMSDGASLFLTVAVMADRTRFPYGAQILPDEEFIDPKAGEQRAVAWLHDGSR